MPGPALQLGGPVPARLVGLEILGEDARHPIASRPASDDDRFDAEADALEGAPGQRSRRRSGPSSASRTVRAAFVPGVPAQSCPAEFRVCPGEPPGPRQSVWTWFALSARRPGDSGRVRRGRGPVARTDKAVNTDRPVTRVSLVGRSRSRTARGVGGSPTKRGVPMTTERKCPFNHAAGGGTSNRDWWPNQLRWTSCTSIPPSPIRWARTSTTPRSSRASTSRR